MASPAPSPSKKSSSSAKSKLRSKAEEQALLAATRGVLDYLKLRVETSTLLQLYLDESRGPFVCRAIVQTQLSLPAQQVLMRLQCSGGSFPMAGVAVWFQKGETLLREVILPELRQWAMIKEEEKEATSANNDAATENDNNNNKKPPEVTMTDEFRQGFTASLCTLQASPWQSIPHATLREWERTTANAHPPTNKRKKMSGTPDPAGPVTPEDLERWTQTVWDSVLHYLVGTTDQTVPEPPPAVVHFLLQTGLMQTDPEYTGHNAQQEAPLVITEQGYDFLIRDQHQQVWHFCLQYLQHVGSLANKEKGERMVKEALLLLICLSFSRIGEAYPASALNKSGRKMLKDLAHFGLLYVRELTVAVPAEDGQGMTTTTKMVFYPTRVALSLIGPTTDAAKSGKDADALVPASAQWSLSTKALDAALAHPAPHDSSHLAIIVQTNFQVCAYTTSELHVSMLALFCDVGTIRRLPNVVFLMMTRDSVKAAFRLGVQARQILRFLEKHAHPKLRVANANIASAGSFVSPIPSNVVDQIWLWDRERGRVNMTLVFQHQCLMEGEFEAIYAFTTNTDKFPNGAHVWSSKRKKLLFLNYAHAERIQNYIRQWRARQAARQQRGAV